MQRTVPNLCSVALAAASIACGGETPEAEMDAAVDAPAEVTPTLATVRIVEPADGSTVGTDVRVVLETTGIEIVPITPPVFGTGHHHVYLDADVASWDQPIPAGDPMVVHKGDGTSEHVFEGVAPGEHRIIAVVANPAHIPIMPPIADTVVFVVGN